MKLFVGAKGLIVREGKVLLLQESAQYQDGTERGKWDVPGGRIEAGETVREGLAREILEESGLEVQPGVLLGVFDGFPEIKGEKCHVVRVYFLCTADSGEVKLSDDHSEYCWVTPEEAIKMKLVDDIAEVLETYKEMA